MKKVLIKFCYGILIGISNLIPGFSGGTMALILGIYEDFTGAIASLTKKPFKVIKELWSLVLGMAIGIVLATFTIVICLQKWPLITSSFFVGLVIATIPLTIKNIKLTKTVYSSWISFGLCAIISALLPFSEYIGLNIDINNPGIFVVIFVFIIAAIAAATMIIPAASGSLILLAFGLFEPILSLVKECLVYLKDGDFSAIFKNCYMLIPFILGCIVGVIVIAKIITYLFKKHDHIIWYGILGLLVSSIFTIYYDAYDSHIKPNPSVVTNHLILNIILSIMFFIIGFMGLRIIMTIANRKQQENSDIIEEVA